MRKAITIPANNKGVELDSRPAKRIPLLFIGLNKVQIYNKTVYAGIIKIMGALNTPDQRNT